MVRVFSCHSFVSQQVFSTKSEPIALFCVGNKLLVSTDQCNIEIYDLSHSEKSCQLVHSFHTVALVHQILHNSKGNYIGTLEVKTTRQHTVTFVRIYLNWLTCKPEQPARARIAGHNVRWTDASTNMLEVVELPLKDTVNHIASCDKTGNFVIAVGRCLKLYYHCTKTLSNSDVMYSDFEPALSIDVGFDILEVAVCGDFLSAISFCKVRVVKLVWSRKRHDSGSRNRYDSRLQSLPDQVEEMTDETTPDKEEDITDSDDTQNTKNTDKDNATMSLPFYESLLGDESMNLEVKDDDYMMWDFKTEDEDAIFIPPSVIQECLQDDKSEEPIEVLGPVDAVAGNPINVEWMGKYRSSSPITSCTILYRCVRFAGDVNRQYLHSLKLLPTYQKDSLKDRLSGLCCFVSGFHEGYMYDVFNGECVHLSTYNYTAKSTYVGVTNSLLHAVTNNGLETYTIRKMAAALLQLEEPTEQWVIPSPISDICLIGYQAFYGIRGVSVAEHDIVMLSKAMESPTSKSWSIYVLRKPPPIQLYSEMLELAYRYKFSNPTAYQQIMLEAYLLIKSALYKAEDRGQVNLFTELVKESCAKIGDHYARDSSSDHVLSVAYYAMSGVSLQDVIKRHKQDIASQDLSFTYQGLLHYLNNILFSQRPLSDDIDEETGDLILEIYSRYQRDKLSAVILNSELINFSDETALSLLQANSQNTNRTSTSVCSSLDCLAIAIIYLQLGEPESALAMVSSMPKDRIVDKCVKNHHLILDNTQTQLSHLAQLLRRHRPEVVISVLVHLHDNKTVDLNKALDLLDVSIFFSMIKLHLNMHVRDYLEALLNSIDRQDIFDKALKLLIQIYINRLKDKNKDQLSGNTKSLPHSHLPRGNGHFVSRHAWLDQLPPFQGNRSLVQQCEFYRTQSFARVSPPQGFRTTSPQGFMKSGSPRGLRPSSPQTIRYSPTRDPSEPCPCCCCNEDLLKLQSLLCWKQTSQETAQQVLELLDIDVKGHVSLQVLCQSRLDINAANKIIVENYPQLTLDYANSMLVSKNDSWVALLQMLQTKVSFEESRFDSLANKHSLYMDAFKGVLSVVAELLEPGSLLGILPSSASNEIFLPYIERCYMKHKADQLQNHVFQQVMS
ncbi:BLOC-2 complex member HPS3-like [Glandiceps talaboti]